MRSYATHRQSLLVSSIETLKSDLKSAVLGNAIFPKDQCHNCLLYLNLMTLPKINPSYEQLKENVWQNVTNKIPN